MEIFVILNPVPGFVSQLSKPGSCWAKMLGDNMVSVRGYPIARRPEHQTGMEIQLPMMLSLANARRLSQFKGIFCIKGYCSIVIPTRRQGDIIYWHLVTNLDGQHISYTDERVVALATNYPRDLSIQDLRTSRHILGWSPEIENLTGEDIINPM